MKNSNIEWTDHTFNPWEGCTKVSPGCAHCYAEARDVRVTGGKHWGKGAPRRRTSEANWKQPLKWDRDARGEGPATLECPSCGVRWHDCACGFAQRKPRVFCASLADWLDDEVPIDWLADLLDLIDRTPNLDWLLLTKRPENWLGRMEEAGEGFYGLDHTGGGVARQWLKGYAPSNVWLGTTVEDQTRADVRMPVLLSIPADVRFLSCEPLLGPVELSLEDTKTPAQPGPVQGIHWVICGGESGAMARPMHPAWAKSLRDQCAAAGVAFFFKQWGEWAPHTPRQVMGRDPMSGVTSVHPAGHTASREAIGAAGLEGCQSMVRFGKLRTGRHLDGVEHNAFPEVAK